MVLTLRTGAGWGSFGEEMSPGMPCVANPGEDVASRPWAPFFTLWREGRLPLGGPPRAASPFIIRMEERTMKRWKLCAVAAVLAGSMIFNACNCGNGGDPITTGTPVPGGIGPDSVLSIEQGFNEEQQQGFWFTTQGTEFIPYDWFLALEQAGSEDLFRSTDNINRLGYIPLGPTKWNPDGLPLGWVKGTNQVTKRDWMGFTCAACHTGTFTYQGTRWIVEGGPTMADFGMYITDLIAAMQATHTDDAKFARFAEKVGDPDGNLREELTEYTDTLTRRNSYNIPTEAAGPAGYSRLDAAGTIFNQVMAWDLGVPENRWDTDAPVAYPAVWDAPHTDLVQWNGSVNNAGVGPVIRNIAEVLGVYLTFHFEREQVGTRSDGTPIYSAGYESSAQLAAQGNLEKWLKAMTSPKWLDALPPIDSAKAEQGRAHYERLCASCHPILENTTDPDRFITAVQTPITELGTDSLYMHNFNWRLLFRKTVTGKLAGRPINELDTTEVFPDTLIGGNKLVVNAGVGILLRNPGEAVLDAVRAFRFLEDNAKWDSVAYRTRPLNGMWATAPYLHNGSVLNYWELLQPDSLRLKTFNVGSHEFDPVNVGYLNEGDYVLDTSKKGNSNLGHSGERYGTSLTDDEKWALIEFLKTL